MNSESGLRLLAGNNERTLLVSSSHANHQHSEVEEGGDHAIMLEAVDPVVVLGASSEKSPERVSVITSRNRNFQKWIICPSNILNEADKSAIGSITCCNICEESFLFRDFNARKYKDLLTKNNIRV